ncbi:MAG: glutathione S-transferase [Rhodospirillaceae bacterium]|jgi:glutathione S-transferase|nr:glutathione S-transferase [Rhodospirillaceae bacterium]MBT6138793.1 glutathione S-transferase [Rhodospirillaceae bacterium]
MKLFYGQPSPFVRKVMITAHELGLIDRLEIVDGGGTPVAPNQDLAKVNPIRKIPTLVTDDGSVLYDSGVICEYLDSLHGRDKIFPAAGPARFEALRLHALADGLMDTAVQLRYEMTLRPEQYRWDEWIDGQMSRIESTLAGIEASVGTFGDSLTIGTISCGCALGYLDFRYSERDWRPAFPNSGDWYADFSQRDSMLATQPRL